MEAEEAQYQLESRPNPKSGATDLEERAGVR